MEWRNPRYNARGTIDVEIRHPSHGWIPFTADPGDRGALFDVGALIAEVEGAGGIAAYAPPPLPDPAEVLARQRAAMSLTFAQMLIGLVAEGWITAAEGEAWLEGRLPAAVNAIVASLPQGQRFAAKVRAARPSVVLRADPLVGALAAAQGVTAEQLDAFFTTYRAI